MLIRYYKLAQLNGYDFQTGKTINYREAIGKSITIPLPKKSWNEKPKLCSDQVLHACLKAVDCFVGANIPCSAYLVEGDPVVDNGKKFGFRRLKILEEISQEKLDEVFGFKYGEACNPVHPLRIKPP